VYVFNPCVDESVRERSTGKAWLARDRPLPNVDKHVNVVITQEVNQIIEAPAFVPDRDEHT